MGDYKAHLMEDNTGYCDPTFEVRLDEGHIPDTILWEGEYWDVEPYPMGDCEEDDEGNPIIFYYMRQAPDLEVFEPAVADVQLWGGDD